MASTAIVRSRTARFRRFMYCVILAGALVTAAFAVVSGTQKRNAASYKDGSLRQTSGPRREINAARPQSTSLSKTAKHLPVLRQAVAAAFRPRMSPSEKATALRCLGELDKALRDASVTYFLYGGTLLGARRHRGIIPWDDDIDVLANYAQLIELQQALLAVDGYELHFFHKNRYKFYPSDGVPIRDKPWRWPYVDVCFYSENATHVYDNYPGLGAAFSYVKADVFPLVYRPFEDLSLPSPANEQHVLARNYDEYTCQSNWFSHRRETAVRQSEFLSVPCTALYSIHPFIFRSGTTPPFKEVLKVDNKTVRELFVM